MSADDELLDAARRLVIERQLGSYTMLMRLLGVGWTRGQHLIDLLERDGVVGPPNGYRAREVLVAPQSLFRDSQ